MSDRIWDAANRLAEAMSPYQWYHRTTLVDKKIGNIMVSYLVVWGKGKRHKEVPDEFDGFRVAYNRVSKQHPCPFGSVKKECRS